MTRSKLNDGMNLTSVYVPPGLKGRRPLADDHFRVLCEACKPSFSARFGDTSDPINQNQRWHTVDMERWKGTWLFLGECPHCGAKYFAQ